MSPRTDTHVHFWDPATGRPGWMSSAHALDRRFEPDDLAPLTAAAGVDRVVAVQADETVEETLHLLDRARRAPWIAGVVGWLDLQLAARPQLERLLAHPAADRLVGIRTALSGRSGGWYRKGDPVVRDGLALLADAGLVLDVLVEASTMPAVEDIVRTVPGLRVVLDHLGQPRAATFDAWSAAVSTIARNDAVAAKVSGLFTALTDADLATAAIARARQVFGERLVVGSDWPVSTAAFSYVETMSQYGTALPDDTGAFGSAAEAIYNLSPGQ